MDRRVLGGCFRKEKIVFTAALLFCFVIHMLLIKQGVNWYCVDIDGYLCHAATFSGRDWSGVFSHAGRFYSWGYSVLLTIPMILTGNTTVVYYFAIVCNAILCCGILIVCYMLAKQVAPDVNRYLLLLCSTAVSLYSSYIFQGAVMLAEIYLYFFVLLGVFCLLQYIKTDRLVWGILSGFLVGYMYIIHNRAVGIVVAYVIVAVAFGIKSKSWKRTAIMLFPLLLMLLLNHGVVQYLNAHEKNGTSYTMNTYGAYTKKLSKNIHFYTFISIMQCVMGECWYALIGTFGMSGVGVYSIIKRTYYSWKDREDIGIWYAFLIFMILGTLAVSVLGTMPSAPMGETGRYDLYIYGRYWEMVFGVLILFGLLECCKGIDRCELINIILGSLLLCVIVEYMTKAYQGNMNGHWWSIPAVLTTFFYPEREFLILNSSIVGLTLMIWIFYLISKAKKGKFVFAVGIWMFFNIFTGYNAIYNVTDIYRVYGGVLAMPYTCADFNDVCKYLEDNKVDEFAVCADVYDYSVMFQVAFPDKKVIGITPETEWAETEVYVLSKATWEEERNGNVIYENAEYCVVR